MHILIPNADSVHDFVGITEEFNFDMDLGDGNRMVDAKSILGILYLGVGKVRNLIVPEERVKLVEEKLSSFLVKE